MGVLSSKALKVLAGPGRRTPQVIKGTAGNPVPSLHFLGDENGFEFFSGAHNAILPSGKLFGLAHATHRNLNSQQYCKFYSRVEDRWPKSFLASAPPIKVPKVRQLSLNGAVKGLNAVGAAKLRQGFGFGIRRFLNRVPERARRKAASSCCSFSYRSLAARSAG
jgi:hypothetical protein